MELKMFYLNTPRESKKKKIYVEFGQAGSFQIQGGAPDGQVEKFPVCTYRLFPKCKKKSQLCT